MERQIPESVLFDFLQGLPAKTADRRSAPGLTAAELLLPDASDPLASRVRITCSVNPRVPNCLMVDLMPNGWQANISLPKTHVARWRDASADARAFLDSHLTDCSTSN
ncbi:hypothetical protein [Tabrizicola flagellatus]|uniref:hypothetical protein n=1 Tax=Tabrizicola flagellatus TaxID=2593021 RepID=UPI0011F2135A|nr:hypothetical protein [Tabrizicola flagellatus]